MLFLGFLTKGFVALFPLSLPFWTWLLGPGGSWKRFLKETGILLASMALLFLLLFLLVPESRTSLPAYFHKQVAGSIRNVVTVESRFYILRRMFTELIPALVLVMVILVFTRKYQGLHVRNHWILSFLAVGLSGVLPIMISMKQRGFYILPAFPFFSMAISLYAAPRVKYLMDQVRFLTIRSVALRYAAASLLVAALLLNGVQFKKAGRDSEMIGDISILQEQIPAGSTIAVTSGLWEEWALHAYFQRCAWMTKSRYPGLFCWWERGAILRSRKDSKESHWNYQGTSYTGCGLHPDSPSTRRAPGPFRDATSGSASEFHDFMACVFFRSR
jgi:hypothetical protein